MPLEDLPNGFTTPTRAEIRDRYQRDVTLRQPGAPTGEGSQAFIDGSVIADALMPIYANAMSIGRAASLADMTRAQLMSECVALGIPEELPAAAGTGFVTITASAGGVYISESRELKDSARNLRFRCATAATYYDGQAVPVIGIDTGPSTNIAAESKLTWTNPPPGLGTIATVQADADGNGLTGGRVAESDDDIRRRISSARSDPPSGGNVAHVRELVKRAGAELGIAIQDVFVYPAITGPGHYCYVFTLRPGTPGSSRRPNAVQIAQVRAYMHRELPEDDGILAGELIDEDVDVKLGVVWANKAEGWVDARPWPSYSDGYYVTSVTSATTFNLKSDAASPVAPEVGRTFAFFDANNSKFARKRIGTVTSLGSGEYTIAVDETNNSSDVNYTPWVTQKMCPYSPSLDLLVEPLLSAVDLVGPGEQVEAPFDEGYRQKRVPENPLEWPSELRHSSLDAVDDLDVIHDIEWLEPDIPYVTSVGVAGASSNLIRISSILAFPS